MTTSVGNIISSLELELTVGCEPRSGGRAAELRAFDATGTAESGPRNRPRSRLRSRRHYYRVPALLARFFHAGFRAIDQVGHDVFTLVLLPRSRFHDSGAQRDLS